MDEGATFRVHDVAARSLLVTFSGVVDSSCAVRLADQVGRRGNRRVVVDLIDATYVDADVQSFLISAAEDAPITVVANQWLLHVLELTRHSRSLQLATSLSEAV